MTPTTTRILGGILVGALATAGCQQQQQDYPNGNGKTASNGAPHFGAAPDGGGGAAADPAAAGRTRSDRVAATINGSSISEADLIAPLVEAHGLNMLLFMVQLELAKQVAAQEKIPVTEDDIRAESDRTHKRLFEELDEKANERIEAATKAGKPEEADKVRAQLLKDHDRLMGQFLQQQHVTPVEWQIVLRTNAYLRKLAEPRVDKLINDDVLRKEFGIKYREKVRVRHIALARPQDAFEAKRRIAAGEPFGKVAREMSLNKQTAVLDGEIPPFSREDPRLPANFKEAAFALKEGEISEMLEADHAYHLIKLEERIQPDKAVVQFEQVKESLRADVRDRLAQSVMREYRDQIGQLARDKLAIHEPVLKRQWQAKLDEVKGQIKEQDDIKLKMERDREIKRRMMEAEKAATQPAGAAATQPALKAPPAAPIGPPAPTTNPAAPAAPAPEAAVPPATRPAGNK